MNHRGDAEQPRATVIIPTLNGGPLLREVLAQVVTQETSWPYAVTIVDSSSADGSLEGLETLPRSPSCQALTTRRIPQAAFSHGRTRQEAAAQARGDYVVFLVQDATPTSSRWLQTLIDAMEGCPSAVGGYARQLPRPDADLLLRRRIHDWTPPGQTPVLKQVTSAEWETLSPLEQVRRAAIDNVCSVVRREALLETPFEDVPFGEDLRWGRAQLLAGRGLLYIPKAMVWHSHRRGFQADRARAVLEHHMLREVFGWVAVPTLGDWMRGGLEAIRVAVREDRAAGIRLLAECTGQAEVGILQREKPW